ncbi:Protein-tyrosine phosphatase, partial [Teladorsagia circumcincta]
MRSRIQSVEGATPAPVSTAEVKDTRPLSRSGKKDEGKVWISKQKNEVETIMKGKNEKCALYHPKTKNECGKFGPYRVYLKEVKPNPFNSIKHIVLSVRKDRKFALDVHHLSCSEWPDHTAPFEAGPIVNMMKMARVLAKGNPIIVHCSAGIGRSATFI